MNEYWYNCVDNGRQHLAIVLSVCVAMPDVLICVSHFVRWNSWPLKVDYATFDEVFGHNKINQYGPVGSNNVLLLMSGVYVDEG